MCNIHIYWREFYLINSFVKTCVWVTLHYVVLLSIKSAKHSLQLQKIIKNGVPTDVTFLSSTFEQNLLEIISIGIWIPLFSVEGQYVNNKTLPLSQFAHMWKSLSAAHSLQAVDLLSLVSSFILVSDSNDSSKSITARTYITQRRDILFMFILRVVDHSVILCEARSLHFNVFMISFKPWFHESSFWKCSFGWLSNSLPLHHI